MNKKKYKVWIVLLLFLAPVLATNETVTEIVSVPLNVTITHNINDTVVILQSGTAIFEYSVTGTQNTQPVFTTEFNYTYDTYEINLSEISETCKATTTLQDSQYHDLRAYLDNTMLPQQSILNNLTDDLTNCMRFNSDLKLKANLSQDRVQSLDRELDMERDNSKYLGWIAAGAILLLLFMVIAEMGLFEKIKGGGYA